jgi:hypothetical protein
VGWPLPLQELKDLLYEVYLAAGAPSLNSIVTHIQSGKGLPGCPNRDTVWRIICEPALPPNQLDVITVAVVLAREAKWSERDLAARAGGLWVKARLATPAGRPIDDFDEPLDVQDLRDLEIHAALSVSGESDLLGALPAYVPRACDIQLASLVAAAAAGQSTIGVVIGGSSTGKTRACWEAVRRLPTGWRLWHPIQPSRRDALLAELPDVAPRTVVWLNEAQDYLEPGPGDHGEEVASRLRTLLRDPRRGPVLVLATLWPEHWDTLTTRSSPDRYAQARELLDGPTIHVPDAFTGTDLAALADRSGLDPRLEEAAAQARDCQITQYLAGVPVMMDRYQNAPSPVTRAMIHAAMDARRLGSGPLLPLDLLTGAAPGYLTEYEWEQQGDSSLRQALDYVTKPFRGIPGILTEVNVDPPRNRRPKPSVSPNFAADPRSSSGQKRRFRLADYLEQHGRRHRAREIPPIDFWVSASRHSHPADLKTLGDAAWNRGLYRDAAQLYKNAVAHHNLEAACSLLRCLHELHPADLRPTQWVTTHISLTDPATVANLVEGLREAGVNPPIAVLAERAANQVSVTDAGAVAELVNSLREAGATPQIAVLADRAANQVPLSDPGAVTRLLGSLERAEAHMQVAVLAERAASEAPVDDLAAVVELLHHLRWGEAHPQFVVFAERATAQAALDDPASLVKLLDALKWGQAHSHIATLLDRNPAAEVALHDPNAVAVLLERLCRAEAYPQITMLLDRNLAAQITLHDPYAVAQLVYELGKVEARQQIHAIAERAATEVALDDPAAVAHLLNCFWLTEMHQQFAVLAERAAAESPIDNPSATGELLARLRQADAYAQITTLLDRDPATHVTLKDLTSVAYLLSVLCRLDGQAQLAALTERVAAQIPSTASYEVEWLFERLRLYGAPLQVSALLERIPIAEMPLEDPAAVAGLLSTLQQVEARPQLTALLERNPAAEVTLDNPAAVAKLLNTLRWVGARSQLTALWERNPAAEVTLDNPAAVAKLLDGFREAEAHGQFAVLAERATGAVALDNPYDVADMLVCLRKAKAHRQVTALLGRNPAALVDLDNAWAVARLLITLRETDAHHPQLAAFAERVAFQVPLDNPSAIAQVLRALLEAEAHAQVSALLDRLPAAGSFDLFVHYRDQFEFGMEPDASAASPWAWEDLE